MDRGAPKRAGPVAIAAFATIVNPALLTGIGWYSRRALEAACWLRLGCWSNNVVNSHPSLGAFNRRVLLSCLVAQCSYPPYRPCHQRRLANCDWMPAS